MSLTQRCAAEFLGVLLLVFFGARAVIIAILLGQGAPQLPNQFTIGITMADWLASKHRIRLNNRGWYLCVRTRFRSAFQPRDHYCAVAARKFPLSDVIPYLITQLAGAKVSSLLSALCIGGRAVDVRLGPTTLFAGVGFVQGILTEAVGMFLLILAVMAVAVDKRAMPGLQGLLSACR